MLAILGIGLDLPPTRDVRALATSHGADTSEYKSWKNVCIARDGDHPSVMGARALKQALERSGVDAAQLKIVIFAGASRDYLPSWSVASEIMNLCGASHECIGLDLTAGCVATLAAIEMVNGWLALRGGGHAAVVVGERWSYTIDFKDPGTSGIWTHGDSGAALVVGQGTPGTPVAIYAGADFASAAGNNGHVLIPYGGTREPHVPAGQNPHARRVSDRPKKEIIESYKKGFADAYATLRRRFSFEAERLVCNQMSPQLVAIIAGALGIPMERVVVTGDDTGHLGGADMVVGLKKLSDAKEISGPVVVAASTAYGFGTGLLLPWAP